MLHSFIHPQARDHGYFVKYHRYIMEPNFRRSIVDKGIVVISMKKTVVTSKKKHTKASRCRFKGCANI